MKFTIITSIIAALALLQGCNAMKGKSDMENMIRLMQQDDPAQFEQVMHLFIQSAKLGEVEKMIDLTSYVTIDKMSIEALKSHYNQDTIPALKACKSISEGGDIIHVDKSETGTGSGWVYRKFCTYSDNEKVAIQFVILNENGRIALTSFGPG